MSKFNHSIAYRVTNDFSNVISDDSYTVTLAAGVAQSVEAPKYVSIGTSITDIPNYLVVFTVGAGQTISVSVRGTAVVPPAAIANTQCMLVSDSPKGRYIRGGQTISLISTAGAEVGLEFYKIIT